MYIARDSIDQHSNNGTVIEGAWRRNMPDQTLYPLETLQNRYIPESANNVRKEYEAYFMSVEGELPWQFKYI